MTQKIYDLRIDSHGTATPMNDGFFKHCDELISSYDESKYIMINNYRISKSDLEIPERKAKIDKFLKRTKK